MRQTITDPGASELVYEIREIVEVAKKFEALGQPITWENIGDPVAKGEEVAPWMKEYVVEAVKENAVYAYSPTKGLQATREYIANERNLEGGIEITPDDILFVNGLGDAISKVYRSLNPKVRVIGPNPAYPTHSSAEAAHADGPHLTYPLDPKNGWKPDLDAMERTIVEHPEIGGILIVNPDNPTGYVYPQDVVRDIVAIAKKHDLFIISDEIYSNLAYGIEHKKLASVIDDVPGIAMRGVSKEFPWPGGRCGWMEFYNRDKDEDFDRFCKSLIDAKMLEVCSTTLPQYVLPRIMKDERYYPMLKERTARYAKRAKLAKDVLSEIPGVIIHEPNGAFYMSLVFEAGVLTDRQTLPVENEAIATELGKLLTGVTNDKRLVYYLLAATGICVVPLTSGFNSTYDGFRFTLLERDDAKFREIIETLRDAIRAYIGS
ncbi:MAG TPA: pyridoxal phosphate-dependent aminotransferase [Candidatus Paceibacterota bacterium]|nr:pyridoxal phosphate-dependent aminotransferase [Candidatus Paceibacterota bacterium]